MKKILTLSFIILLSSSITSQIWEKSLLVELPNASLEEKYEAFKKYRKTYMSFMFYITHTKNLKIMMMLVLIMLRKPLVREIHLGLLLTQLIQEKLTIRYLFHLELKIY